MFVFVTYWCKWRTEPKPGVAVLAPCRSSFQMLKSPSGLMIWIDSGWIASGLPDAPSMEKNPVGEPCYDVPDFMYTQAHILTTDQADHPGSVMHEDLPDVLHRSGCPS
ncbi:hypothetical protein ON010_g3787 [Phytophthora cinnamomi]|nr:hypothetical protein ON010_g3787 [Phytophthora cinnamomi]